MYLSQYSTLSLEQHIHKNIPRTEPWMTDTVLIRDAALLYNSIPDIGYFWYLGFDISKKTTAQYVRYDWSWQKVFNNDHYSFLCTKILLSQLIWWFDESWSLTVQYFASQKKRKLHTVLDELETLCNSTTCVQLNRCSSPLRECQRSILPSW